MTLNIPTSSKLPNHQSKPSPKDLIKITPQKYIVFQCEDDQPMGQIRITVLATTPNNWLTPDLEFQLTCTNKENYKVSCSRGKLQKDTASHLIRIYIKNIDNLEKCLSDKFRIKIFQTNRPQNILLIAKLKVLIEKHKQSIKIDDLSANINQTASRTASIYTNPSVYMNPSALSSTMATDVKSIIHLSRILANQHKKISPLQQKEQTLNDFKLQFDEWNQKFYTREKQLKTAENNFQKNKAKEKLCLGLLIIVFILSVLFGFLLKRLVKSDVWHGIYDYAKTQLLNWN